MKRSFDRRMELPDLVFLSCGYEERRADFDLSAPVRDYSIIHFILGGSGQVYVNGQRREVTRGQCFLMPENVQALYHSDPEDPWVYCWLAFSGADSARFLSDCGFGPARPVLPLDDVDAIKDLVLEMLDYDHDDAPWSWLYVQSLFLEILSKVEKGAGRPFYEGQNSDNDLIRDAVGYIEDHVGEGVTVEDVAEALYISRGYLFTLFKDHLHVSPKRFIMRARLSRVQELLLKTDMNLREIAKASGYGNQFSMSRAFSQECGESPREWRSRIRGAADKARDAVPPAEPGPSAQDID